AAPNAVGMGKKSRFFPPRPLPSPPRPHILDVKVQLSVFRHGDEVERMAKGTGRAGVWGWIAALAVVGAGPAPGDVPYEQEPIGYLTAEANDPVARLQKRVEKGEVKLDFDEEGQGYLKAVLKALKVPEASQTLVFSKTSFQAPRIGPKTPRALYFGDDVYVGYVRGGDVLEFSTVDPNLGATFYLLDQNKTEKPEFVRQTH